jgi:hypothetical protein
MKFIYYIDGEMVSEYLPDNVVDLKKSTFNLDIGIWGESAVPMIGYIDDVKIETIRQ